MSSVLIDNSTITSLQRLSGSAPSPRSYDPQGDYAAFEALASSLIFNDDFYCIDDYKEEFKEIRFNEFRFIKFICKEHFPYSNVVSIAKDLTEDLILDIRSGHMEPGIVKNFLESIGLHLTAAWHMRSSDFFLTLKILANEPDNWDTRYKYSPLSALIFDQVLGREEEASDAAMRLVGSNGKDVIERIEGKRQYAFGEDIKEFAAALNWLTWRTAFYSLSAAHFDATLGLHPIRHNFLCRWASDRNVLSNPENWKTSFADFFAGRATEAINRINQTVDATEVGLDLPLFAAWSVGKTGNVRDAMSFLLEQRLSSTAVALRQKMKEIDQIRSMRTGPKWKMEANRLALAVSAESASLVRRFGAEVGNAPVLSINTEIGLLPKISVGLEAEVGNFGVKFGSARRLRGLFRNIVNDVVGFDELGDVRRSLTRQVRKSESKTIPALHIEEYKYLGKSSQWKEKM